METRTLVPMQWPCGPLGIVEGDERGGFTPEERETFTLWARPDALDILDGSLVNGLLVPWAFGSPTDGEQHRALAPLVAAAHDRDLTVVGRVAATADLAAAAAAARLSGLDAVATDSDETAPGILTLRFRDRRSEGLGSSSFVGVTGCPWPGMAPVRLGAQGVDAESGPTGRPWIDSNAWFVRFVRQTMNPRAVWLAFDPATERGPLTADDYVRAIADTAVHGGLWIVSLDAGLRAGLSRQRAEARETWTEISRALRFFDEHRSWQGYAPVGHLGVLSDFSGPDASLSLEVLNLLARQGSLFQILPKDDVVSLDGLNAVLYLDEEPPGAALRQRLDAFAEKGGTLVVPPGWSVQGPVDEAAVFARYRVIRQGLGRVAVAREFPSDPYLLAQDAQLLMSHAHDRVRLFNPGLAQHHYTRALDGRSGVLHLLRHGRRDDLESQVTTWFREPWASARAWRVSDPGPAPLERRPVKQGVEFPLPRVGAYCAVETSA